VFVVLQHPFADLRTFLGTKTGRLPRPVWPLAEPGREFVRSCGAVKPRPLGGANEWPGEEVYVDASRALKMPNQLRQLSLGHALRGQVTHVIRRFHSQGTVSRMEIGLRVHLVEGQVEASQQDWLTLLNELLGLPVKIGSASRQKPIRLVEAGSSLASHLLKATTETRSAETIATQSWWVCPGNPSVIVEYPSSLPLVHPPYSRFAMRIPAADASIWHAWLPFGQRRCSTWLVERGENGDADTVRRLRIHLSRLHAERECLAQILRQLSCNDFSLFFNANSADSVQRYLNDGIRNIKKPMRFGFDQLPLLEVAEQAQNIVFSGETSSLSYMRRQVATKVRDYLARLKRNNSVVNNIAGDVMNTYFNMSNSNISGSLTITTAKNIENSFNAASADGINADLATKLQRLVQEVTALARALPAKEAELLSEDLKTFTTQAASKEPRKAWYELSAKGIKEAAKTVASLASPVTLAVDAVLDMLAH